MFKDEKEELYRLQQALLAEEEEAAPGDTDETDLLTEDPLSDEGPIVYRNYSNNYGRDLRNYATGYRAYNSDKTDEDLDRYSEEVRQGRKSNAPLVVTACLLAAGILAVMIFWLLRYGGLF